MPQFRLRYKSKISLKQSIDKIVVYGMWSDHDIKPRPTSKKDISTLLRGHGIDPDVLANECCNYKMPVALFERERMNKGTATTYKGGSISIIDRDTEETLHTLNSPGTIVLLMYMDKFNTACEYRDRAVIKSSITEYQSAIVHGMASIESYIHSRVQRWNKGHPDDLLVDNQDSKISFQKKFDEWIPKMTGGAKVKKGDQRWNNYLTLKRFRDDFVVHPKDESYAISYDNLITLINGFRFGIAGMLGQIHLLFGQPLPNKIINAFYMPDVEQYQSSVEAG